MTNKEIIEYYSEHKELYDIVDDYAELVKAYRKRLINDYDLSTIIERSNPDAMMLGLYELRDENGFYSILEDLNDESIRLLLELNKRLQGE
jgi:hypothetical protein